MSIQVKVFTFNEFEENTYLLYGDSKECIIVDPGCGKKSEQTVLADYITQHELTPIILVNTHCHIDHVLGNAWVSDVYNLSLFAHELEKTTLQMQEMVAQMYGLAYLPSPPIGAFLKEGEFIATSDALWKILFVPGHAPGHICLYNAEEGICISGDTLFDGSIGRTDLPGGHHDTLISKIKTELFTLPEDTIVFPGHGGDTTIGKEKKTNPFF